MKQLSILFVITAILLSACSSKSHTEIEITFNEYKSAILNNGGEKSYSVIDQKTKDYYSWLQKSSVNFTKDDIMKLGILDKMQIIIMRHRIPSQKLAKMTGKELFIHAVDNGWVGKNGVSKLGIGKIRVDNNFGTGEVSIDGNPSSIYYHFHKENDKWKIGVMEMTKLGQVAISNQQKLSGKSEEE